RVGLSLEIVADLEEIWVPLVDEPIGSIVQRLQLASPAVTGLVSTPRRLLAFRTFAYIRVGLVLGQLLFDHDLPSYDGSEAWTDALLADPAHHAALAHEVRAVEEAITA